MNISSEKEKKDRLQLWKIKKEKVKEHNKLYAENKTTYKRAEYIFNILNESEFEASYKGLSNFSYGKDSRHYMDEFHNSSIRRTKNWTDEGFVSKVQNQSPEQGGCASCWAFSAAGAIEAAYKRLYNDTDVVDLSESYLINCMDDDYTCKSGSNPLYAFKHVSRYGIATEKQIPYKAVKDQCNTSNSSKLSTITTTKDPRRPKTTTRDPLNKIKNWVLVKEGEKYLQEAVDEVGPVSALICAAGDFSGYHKGIYDDDKCSSYCRGKVDHAVLVVGYGEENTSSETNKPYWLVKNSWGTEWGEQVLHRHWYFIIIYLFLTGLCKDG
jgi:C1A family cysteine protease